MPLGHNPVALLLEKPTARRQEAKWLEAHEAALLLESARTYRPKRDDMAMPFAHPLLAAFLLTGGRASEVLGLEVEDLSFDRRTVTFRPNDHRRLKTLTSHRTVPMWPQLEEVLREYVFGGEGPASGLLFPSSRTGRPKMLTDVRKMLDAIGERAGWEPGEIRSKMFRHAGSARDAGPRRAMNTLEAVAFFGFCGVVAFVIGYRDGQSRRRGKGCVPAATLLAGAVWIGSALLGSSRITWWTLVPVTVAAFLVWLEVLLGRRNPEEPERPPWA